MRLSATNAWNPKGAFKLANTMAELGFHTRLGSQITSIPDAEYPWNPEIVKQIRKEFDPAWTPLFCRERWMTPNKGVVVIGRHMVGRHVPIPRTDVDVLQVLRPTCGAWWGVTIKTPILESMTLELRDHAADCACDSCKVERDSGGMVRKDLGRYVAFDNRVYLTCKAIWHQNHHKRAKELAREITRLQVEAPKEESAKAMLDLRDELRSEWPRLTRIRQAETEYDRQKAAAPRAVSPMVIVGKSAGKYPGH